MHRDPNWDLDQIMQGRGLGTVQDCSDGVSEMETDDPLRG